MSTPDELTINDLWKAVFTLDSNGKVCIRFLEGSTTWKPPVDTIVELPTIGNSVGDSRIVKEDFNIYIWNGTEWINSVSGVTSIIAGSGIAVSGSGNVTVSADVDTTKGLNLFSGKIGIDVDTTLNFALGKLGINATLKTNYDTAYSHSQIITGNPHGTTKTDISLGNVDNIQQMPLSYLDTDITLTANSDTKVPSQKAIKTYVDGLVAGLVDLRGAYDASGNTFPTTGGSGTAGAIMKGDTWIISVAGTLGGTAVQIGDWVMALVDNPGQTSGNWGVLNTNISYVPEDVANKKTSMSGNTTSDTYYLSAKAIYDWGTGAFVGLTGNQTVAGEKTFSSGCEFQSGAIFYGERTPFPTVAGGYIALYKSSSYNVLHFLGYNGSSYQDVAMGALLGSTFPIILKADGTTQINVGSDATGDIYYRNSSGVFTRLGIGASGKFLSSNGTIPVWGDGGLARGTSITANANSNGLTLTTSASITSHGVMTISLIGNTNLRSDNITSTQSSLASPTTTDSTVYGQGSCFRAYMGGTYGFGFVGFLGNCGAGNRTYGRLLDLKFHDTQTTADIVAKFNTGSSAYGHIACLAVIPGASTSAIGYKVDASTTGTGKAFSALKSATERTALNPFVENGATAVAYLFDTSNTLSTAGSKIVSYKNAGTEKAYIDKDGNMSITGSYQVNGVAIGPRVKIYDTTLGSDSQTMDTGTFASYNFLKIIVVSPGHNYGANTTYFMRFNGDTTANNHYYGSAGTYIQIGASVPASTPVTFNAEMENVTGYKKFGWGMDATYFQKIIYQNSSGTNLITSILLSTVAGQMLTGTRLIVYGYN